jgi:hypothetical protein
MNKKIFPLLLGLLVMAFQVVAVATRPLTFEARVKAQEAIERVYYNHRIWPKENPGPKPPFEQMMPEAMLVAKVTDYLKKSAALDEFWQKPITAEQLQAEMERMAKGTKDPATLKELFAALGNDPTLIAECLARPILADRLIRNWYANDERFHGETKAKAEAALALADSGSLSLCDDGNYQEVAYVLSDSEESAFPQENMKRGEIALDKKRFEKQFAECPEEGKPAIIRETPEAFLLVHTILKIASRIEVGTASFPKRTIEEWLKTIGPIERFEAGTSTAYNFAIPVVTATACGEGWYNGNLGDVPDPRSGHTAVWTGTEMIVWGGSSFGYLLSGGRYNPSTDSWTGTSSDANVPVARSSHTAVWTGTEMIVWGGRYGLTALNSGGRYNPLTDEWAVTSTGANVPSARYDHTAVWTGTEMIVWGGFDTTYTNSGGRYAPSADSWIATSLGGSVPSGRNGHTAVWTGSAMVVWGGYDGSSAVNSGGRYDPSGNTWTGTSLGANVPLARNSHTAVWTGTEMIVWGGYGGGNVLNSGGRYAPSTDTWVATSSGSNVPSARDGHTAVWTGSEMIVWGGWNGSTWLNIGGRYRPSTDTWTAISGTNAPSARYSHTAVWAGSEMIVWGGWNGSSNLNSGGRYSSSTDTWTPTSTGLNVPSARMRHTAIWTGAEMVVWGGYYYSGVYYELNTGGKYNPATDSWSATSTGANVPSGRESHTAVWTGTEMIVWGGDDRNNIPISGGRYSPSTDIWTATSKGPNVPSGRFCHTAVWTGTDMVVWGGYDWTSYLNTGGRYNPLTETWTATSTGPNVPSGRECHTAVWTGSKMIVWGGYYFSSGDHYLRSGGLYDPSTNSWTVTSTGPNVPSARAGHTAVWTDSVMVVWGGYNGTTYSNAGGLYNPSSNTWAATSTGTNVPSARTSHSAIWTGAEMVIWGGHYDDGFYHYLNTGGRYNPLTNTWLPTSTIGNVPQARDSHTAVWTGSEMIVWAGYEGTDLLNTGGQYYITHVPYEVPNTTLVWSGSGKDTLSWSAASCATGYRVYRGDQRQMQNLPTGATACLSYDGTGTTTGATQTAAPSAGSFYWYLAVGYDTAGEGSAGSGTNYPLRMIVNTGTCP